jgi:DNA-binding PadR family transcriptional regulator
MAHRGRIHAYGAESQYYAEPKRLERLGYLSARREPGRTRERTHYTLTDKGLAALRDWARRPTPFPRIQSRGDHTPARGRPRRGGGSARELGALRGEIADLSARLDEADAIAQTLPHRRKYLELNQRLARRLLKSPHQEWVDEVERELAPGGQDSRWRTTEVDLAASPLEGGPGSAHHPGDHQRRSNESR